MSLNWREIDIILSELDVIGAQVQKVVQPSYDTLVLSLYKPGVATELLFCIAHGACRIHATTRAVPKAEKPQRFMELLRSQIRGARVE
ncbi:MAG: NFACT family protein, partial [Spirochaetales bacterium]|nr:NFACT family protein [Spirochaetales bacterium]